MRLKEPLVDLRTKISCAAQAQEEGRLPSDKSSHLLGPDQAQPGSVVVSRGSCDGSEPGIGNEWDVCAPAEPDAVCKVALASTSQSGTWGDTAAKQSTVVPADTPAATVSQEADLEDADVAPQLSMSPAYSMLPWDKPGAWPAVGNSTHGMESQASMPPSIASYAPHAANAAPSAPAAFTHQPSRLSLTVAGPTQQPSPQEGTDSTARPLSSWKRLESRQHVYTLDPASAERHQHDGISIWADLPGSTRSSHATWSRGTFAAPPVAASVEYGQHGGAFAQEDTLGNVQHDGAIPPSHSSVEPYHEHSYLSQEAPEANHLDHELRLTKDSHEAPSAQGGPAGHIFGQAPGHIRLVESASQAMAWGGTSHSDGLPNAEMQRSHDWLHMHGYSDATVLVTATQAEDPSPLDTAEPGAKHARGSSLVKAPLPGTQMLADSLPGAIQHSAAPSSLNTSSSRIQMRSAADASSAWQPDANLMRPGTPNSRTSLANHPIGPAASSVQSPVNVQDVALNRTIPSIWDLDL